MQQHQAGNASTTADAAVIATAVGDDYDDAAAVADDFHDAAAAVLKLHLHCSLNRTELL